MDFDNTIAGYDHVFAEVAIALGLLPKDFAGDKRQVKSTLQGLPDGETAWMRVQGQVYGTHMPSARLIDGVAEFLQRSRAKGAQIAIVSHKTVHGHFDPNLVNLHTASRRWMESQGFFDHGPEGYGLSLDSVYFELTRADKIRRIAALGCTHFVDDLPEVLADPNFPAGVVRHLISIGEAFPPPGPYKVWTRWQQITDEILGPV